MKLVVNEEWREAIKRKSQYIDNLDLTYLKLFIERNKDDEELLRKKLGVFYEPVIAEMFGEEQMDLSTFELLGIDPKAEDVDILKIVYHLIDEEEKSKNSDRGDSAVNEMLNNIEIEDKEIEIEDYWQGLY